MDFISDSLGLDVNGDLPAQIALVEAAAAQGKPEGLFVLANWRLYGVHGPRDPHQALHLMRAAHAAGLDAATAALATFAANGATGAADETEALALLQSLAPRHADSAAQLALLAAEKPTATYQTLPHKRFSQEPLVLLVRGVFSRDECRYLIAQATPHLQPSPVVDPLSGRRIKNPVRTSDGMSFGPSLENLAIRHLNQRLAALTGTAVACGEPLNVLRYQPGQQYRLHHDALGGTDNQRILTALIYLNDSYKGGETAFPDLKLRVRGQQGDLLIFRNVDAAGRPHPLARHAGLPVTHGMKWLASRWIHQAAFDPWPFTY